MVYPISGAHRSLPTAAQLGATHRACEIVRPNEAPSLPHVIALDDALDVHAPETHRGPTPNVQGVGRHLVALQLISIALMWAGDVHLQSGISAAV